MAETSVAQLEAMDQLTRAVYPTAHLSAAARRASSSLSAAAASAVAAAAAAGLRPAGSSSRPSLSATNASSTNYYPATNPARYASTSHAVEFMMAAHKISSSDLDSEESHACADAARAGGGSDGDAAARNCNMLQVDPREAERRLTSMLRELISELLDHKYLDRDIERSMSSDGM
jgi:hypothetical protein